MLPYSAVAAIDYAAYQSRPAGNNGGSFAHSWLVPTQEMCGANFKPNPQNHLVVDPGHVDSLLFSFLYFLCCANVGTPTRLGEEISRFSGRSSSGF
jgi:hypothetical protein